MLDRFTSLVFQRLSSTLPELEGELWLLTHPDLRNTARVRAFLDFCAAALQPQPGRA